MASVFVLYMLLYGNARWVVETITFPDLQSCQTSAALLKETLESNRYAKFVCIELPVNA